MIVTQCTIAVIVVGKVAGVDTVLVATLAIIV